MNYIFLQIVITPHISGNNSCQKESRTNISIFNSRIYTTYFLLHRYLSFKKFTFRILSHNKFCELAREILSLIHSCKCTKLTNRKAYIRKRSFYCLLGKDKSGTPTAHPVASGDDTPSFWYLDTISTQDEYVEDRWDLDGSLCSKLTKLSGLYPQLTRKNRIVSQSILQRGLNIT